MLGHPVMVNVLNVPRNVNLVIKVTQLYLCYKRTNEGRKYTNFESNLATMVIYLPVKFEFDWKSVFELRVRKRKCWRTNELTELHQFWKEPSYDGDLSPCQVWIRLDTVFSSYSPEIEMFTDRQTDKKWTNEWTELHQFQKEPSYNGDLSPCQVWIRLDTAFSS